MTTAKSTARAPNEAEPATRRGRRSDELLSVLASYQNVVVLMHDNPDPDAIASGWALKHLVEEKLQKHVRLVGGGAIVRAENRHMVKLLEPPLELVDELQAGAETAVVLVDCGPQAANHLCAESNVDVVAMIDHHECDPSSLDLPFVDSRPGVAASVTIVGAYLREQELPPNVLLATAMIYAMRTEVRGQQTHHSSSDRAILPWLTQFADPQLLAEIEDAPLPRAYYSDLLLALQCTFTYGSAGFCVLPRAEGAEIVGEVADLLIRCDEIHRMFCATVIDNDIVVSVRTDEFGGNAALLVEETLRGLGRAGGHSHRAGGKIPGRADGNAFPDALQDDLRTRWLRACGAEDQHGVRLVKLREIVQNL